MLKECRKETFVLFSSLRAPDPFLFPFLPPPPPPPASPPLPPPESTYLGISTLNSKYLCQKGVEENEVITI